MAGCWAGLAGSFPESRSLPNRTPGGGADANRALRRIFEVYDDFRVEAAEYVDAGDTIVVVVRGHGTARGSGLQMDQRLAQAWAVREGKPVRMEQYPTRSEALKAVGLAD